MTAIDERTATQRVTHEELARARAVLDGVPVGGPVLRCDPVVPAQRSRSRSADAAAVRAVELVHVLEDGRARLVRLAGLLDAASRDAVLR